MSNKIHYHHYDYGDFVAEINLKDTVNNTELIELIKDYNKEKSIESNVKSWHFGWLIHNEDSRLKNLVCEIERIANVIFQKTNGWDTTVKIVESWIINYQFGNYAINHRHWPLILSCCYYIDTNDGNCPPIVFSGLQENGKEKILEIFPKNSDLVIFPGYLLHKVKPMTFKHTTRKVFAANLFVNSLDFLKIK